ncbi:MAG TPA: TetR/AcrR family transcriptional regulator [Smithella sp.]|nr:TetR/AcrR family transcriptional regulator [Deltaproteobacteria bacterium]OQC52927.1 MAG: Fatty acid metabolism regulator protein [Deltaproteobacteria bacterium ADurb.Bin022]HNQ64543.1 TetR/AcrR family transcriptional regulator [Smithella sp.]HOE32295.1 TetR/AcrR family transcriptional regulator [Smithella sp.]HOG09237.1 TetR/AcrR family transcriptional regulator [Smithella sp.]
MTDKNRPKTRKDRIMDAALRIFAEKGFQNATITEISKAAGVSEATIYEYFGTKEDLLFAIPEKITNDTFEESSKVIPYIKGVEGKIRAILLFYVKLYQSNPNYSALVLLQLMSNRRFRQTPAHAAIRTSAHTLLDCIREGIADGTFKKDSNPYLIRSVFMGTIEHLFIHWHMQGMPKKKPGIAEMLDALLETVFDGIRARKEDSGTTLYLKLDDAGLLEKILKKGRERHQNKK